MHFNGMVTIRTSMAFCSGNENHSNNKSKKDLSEFFFQNDSIEMELFKNVHRKVYSIHGIYPVNMLDQTYWRFRSKPQNTLL